MLQEVRVLDSRCHGARGSLRVLLETSHDRNTFHKYTLLVKGLGVAYVASEEGVALVDRDNRFIENHKKQGHHRADVGGS